MTRKFTFAVVLMTTGMLGTVATADEPVRSASPFRTAEYSQDDAQIVQVRNGYRRNYYGSRNYYGNRGYYNNYYSPYGYRNYYYRPYPNRYYYGRPNYGYYNYYGGRGGVRVGPVDVWW